MVSKVKLNIESIKRHLIINTSNRDCGSCFLHYGCRTINVETQEIRVRKSFNSNVQVQLLQNFRYPARI